MKNMRCRLGSSLLLLFLLAFALASPPARAADVAAPSTLEMGGTNGVLYRLFATNYPVYQSTIDCDRVDKFLIGLSSRWMTNTITGLTNWWRFVYQPDRAHPGTWAGSPTNYNFIIPFKAETTNTDWFWFEWSPPVPAGTLSVSNIWTPNIWGTNAGGEYICVSNVALKYIRLFKQ